MRVELYRLSMHCVQTSKSLFLVVGKLSLTLLWRFYLQPIVGRPKNLSGGPGVPLTHEYRYWNQIKGGDLYIFEHLEPSYNYAVLDDVH